ncbi:jg4609 [Pararge aegeria aegeria]|uniref:Jg4609 protein n=1 Tax=Pararge aegeria aegeria TaxID=348720 RepID=A0A8S4RSA7_9NEOP|nr:jg4609 [Pararge aegeria aegeria]
MNRNSKSVEANEELQILLVVTVVIGLLLMLSLLMCYAFVLKRLFCDTPREQERNKASTRRTESYPMGDVTLISQPTESECV